MVSKNLKLFLLLLTLISQIVCSQSVVRSSLSCLGSSVGDNGFLYRQTIGQPSNTTVFNNSGLVLRQGFQQPIALYISEKAILPLDFTLSPNPAGDETLLEFGEELPNITISIRNINGILIAEYTEKSLQTKWLNLKTYPSGTYIITATHDSQTGSKKLIITH